MAKRPTGSQIVVFAIGLGIAALLVYGFDQPVAGFLVMMGFGYLATRI